MRARLFAVAFAATIAAALAPASALAAEPPSVDSQYATDVSSESVTFNAQINPHGVATEYTLEYGTGTTYGQTVKGAVGSTTGDMHVEAHVQHLAAGTTYHYRFMAVSECEAGHACEGKGGDVSVSTWAAPASSKLSLPDGRMWELVTPVNKHGGLINPEPAGVTQAAPGGGGIAFMMGTASGEAPQGAVNDNPLVSSRTPDGWRTSVVTPAMRQPENGEQDAVLQNAAALIDAFSPELSVGVFSAGLGQVPFGFEQKAAYLRDTATGRLTPLVTCANVEETPCPPFGGESEALKETSSEESQMLFEGATPDLSHIVVSSPYALVPPAVSLAVEKSREQLNIRQNLYEWRRGGEEACTHPEGCVRLVNVLADGAPTTEGASLGQNGSDAAQAISRDGRWVVWAAGHSSTAELYVRDMVAGKTVRIGGTGATFQAMSADGSKVFYSEHEHAARTGEGEEDLYVCEPTLNASSGALECRPRDLTGGHPVGGSAEVQDGVVGISEDGSYVYFVAKAVLAAGAVAGEDNLYLLHDEGRRWSTRLVATLSSNDEKDWTCPTCMSAGYPKLKRSEVTSRVSPNGRFVAFMSERPLTGRDSHDAVSGEPDEQVFLYDAGAESGKGGRLVCASCNPTGARPSGILDPSKPPFPSIDSFGVWSARRSSWLAAMIPGWDEVLTTESHIGVSPYQSRYLSDQGRLFFDATDALVPQDTNGVADVYEYEPVAGEGAPPADNCTTSSITYHADVAGCVNLISSGIGAQESAFMDASESGEDVFFQTGSRLTGEDTNTEYDIYDAHVCSAAVPCHVAPPVEPECTSTASCRLAPAAQPTVFGAPPSATFDGLENRAAEKQGKRKALTRAQRLLRALRACHRMHGDRRRGECVRRARRRFGGRRGERARYGSVHHRSGKASRRGHGR